MLKLPAFKQYDDCTVFQDDAQFWRFYVIPGFPKVRLGPDGTPIFQLIKYGLSDESRDANPDLPRGGGFLVFDAELKIDEDRQAEIEDDLQEYVGQELARRQAAQDGDTGDVSYDFNFSDDAGEIETGGGMWGGVHASDTGDRGSTITLPRNSLDTVPVPEEEPTVVLSEPLWTGGTVKMNTFSADSGLVRATVAERPAPTFGTNVAAFAIELTEDGASIMQQLLVDDDGDGATDLAPIQVAYELTMLAKLPPARARVRVNTSKAYQAVYEFFHEHENCTDDYFTSESFMEIAVETGLCDVFIDAGGVTDENIIELLTNQALQVARQVMTDKFGNKDHREITGSEVSETDHREVYTLKRVNEVEMVDFEQTITLASTIEHTLNPQATLQTFCRGRDMAEHVREVDAANDPLFQTLNLEARAFARWDEDDIAAVEVQVEYGEGELLKTKSFTFTPDNYTEPQIWDPRLVEGSREVRYRWRVAFEGHDFEPWNDGDAEGEGFASLPRMSTPGIGAGGAGGLLGGLLGGLGGGGLFGQRTGRRRSNVGWIRTTGRHLNVSVETPGKLDLDISGAALDFKNHVVLALVEMRYSDPGRGLEPVSHVVLLTKEQPSGEWTRRIGTPWDQPLEYRVQFLLQNGEWRRQDWTRTEGAQGVLVIEPPKLDTMDVLLVPAGRGWDSVVQCVVSIGAKDQGSGEYREAEAVRFETARDFRTFSVLVDDDTPRDFRYRVLATYESGELHHPDWVVKEGDQGGDQTVPVVIPGPPILKVGLLGAAVDFNVYPVVKVHFEYTEPLHLPPGVTLPPELMPEPTVHPQTFTLTGAKEDEAKFWIVPIQEDWTRTFTYQITWYDSEGGVHEGAAHSTDENLVVVPGKPQVADPE